MTDSASYSRFEEILRSHWPYPRGEGEGTIYFFGSDVAAVELVWFGPTGGYGCEVVTNPEADRQPWTSAHAEWIGDAWGAEDLTQACLTLEDAMSAILESEGRDPRAF